MSKVVITDSSKFEIIVQELEKSIPRIGDIFIKETNEFDKINDTDTWSGETQQVIYQKYQELTKNYEPIKESLENYVKFLKVSLENYKKFEDSLNNMMENNNESLNVN